VDVREHHSATAVLVKTHLIEDLSLDRFIGVRVVDIDVSQLQIIRVGIDFSAHFVLIILNRGDVGDPLIGHDFSTRETTDRDYHS